MKLKCDYPGAAAGTGQYYLAGTHSQGTMLLSVTFVGPGGAVESRRWSHRDRYRWIPNSSAFQYIRGWHCASVDTDQPSKQLHHTAQIMAVIGHGVSTIRLEQINAC